MPLRAVVPALLVLVLALPLGGCGGDEGSQDADGRDRVVVVGSEWYGHLPVWVGIEKGFFERAGFVIDWRTIGKSMDRMNAIASGKAQFASLGEIAMIGAMAHGNDRFYWVGNQDIAPGFEGLVAREGITSFAELKDKKIGYPFASSVDLTCRLLLKANGLVPGTDVKMVNLEVGDVPQALRGGNVDAALVWEPGFSKLLEIPGVTVLGMDTDTEVYKKFGTMTGPDVLIVSKKWADEDEERAQRFLAAYFLAVEWVKQNQDAAVDLVVGRYIQQDIELVRKNLAKFVWHGLAKQHEIMTDEGIYGQAHYVAKMLHEDLGTIPNVPDVQQWAGMHLLPLDDADAVDGE
jgi:ABC-type nitrate/sulfonate/bicarbonate transport system substrate-binding protein